MTIPRRPIWRSLLGRLASAKVTQSQESADARKHSSSEKPVQVGRHTIWLDQRIKHERTYYTNSINGIDDVDTAIAKRFMRAGDRVLDLGANIGFNTLHYLRLGAAEVHAVEPHPELYSRLATFQDERLFTYPVAISSAPGKAQLILSQTHNQGHTLKREIVSIRPSVFGTELKEVAVKTTTADLLFPRSSFDYVKVDIEGSELDFIEGATDLLRRHPPRILQIEIKPELFENYFGVLHRHFSNCVRIDYNRVNGEINVAEPSASHREGFRNVPPNYVLFNDEAI